MKKHYINNRNGHDTSSAAQALHWHHNGDPVQVNTFNDRGTLVNVVNLAGAAKPKRDADKENFEHCKHIAQELEAYANGCVYRCPECDEIILLPDDIGDKYRCPECGTVHDLSDLEQLGIWDYMKDILDIDYIVNSRREYKACRILVAYGGPNIYIDTDTGYVELYWWTDRARYALASDAIKAVDEWAEEYWNL